MKRVLAFFLMALFLFMVSCSNLPTAPTETSIGSVTFTSAATSSESESSSFSTSESSSSTSTSTTRTTSTASTTASAAVTTASSTASLTSTSRTSTTTTSRTSTTTTSRSTTTTPSTTRTTTTAADPYAVYSNEDLSWWYRRPAPGERATIDAGIQSLISSYGAVWQLAPSGQKRVYLTMDAGYEFENNTTEILDIAAAKGVPITFFITGSYLNNNFGLVQRMINEGHQVGNHTQRHLRASAALETSTQTFISDLLELEMNYLSLTGRPMPKLYRPAEGGYSERSLKIAKDFAYTTVFWSFAYRDWLTDDQPDPDAAFDLIMSELHDGSILLLHAVSDTNVAILPRLIDAIRAEGYTFVLLQPQS